MRVLALFLFSVQAVALVEPNWSREISTETHELDIPVSAVNLDCRSNYMYGITYSWGRLHWDGLKSIAQLKYDGNLYSKTSVTVDGELQLGATVGTTENSCLLLNNTVRRASEKNGLLHATVIVHLQEEFTNYNSDTCIRQLHEAVHMEIDGMELNSNNFIVLEKKPCQHN